MRRRKQRRYSGIGGQAVLEGVMMRNRQIYAVAVRKPDGKIAVEMGEYRGIAGNSAVYRIPFLRGIFVFIDSLILGMRTLNISAAYYEEDAPAEDGKRPGGVRKAAEHLLLALTTLFSFALALGIFVVLPYFIASGIVLYVRSAALQSLFEGIARILIFIVYILLISMMKDIRRLFRYHGAEHKCINCIEGGHPLTVYNVMRASRLHRRCGSSFILFVMFVSIILFFFIRTDSLPMRLLLRIALLPVISGISYEIIRLAGRSDHLLIRAVSAPGLWLQRLTTKEPDTEMAEVAIRSVETVFDWRTYLRDEFGYELEDPWLADDEAPDEEESYAGDDTPDEEDAYIAEADASYEEDAYAAENVIDIAAPAEAYPGETPDDA